MDTVGRTAMLSIHKSGLEISRFTLYGPGLTIYPWNYHQRNQSQGSCQAHEGGGCGCENVSFLEISKLAQIGRTGVSIHQTSDVPNTSTLLFPVLLEKVESPTDEEFAMAI
jgi:hypothetical protein